MESRQAAGRPEGPSRRKRQKNQPTSTRIDVNIPLIFGVGSLIVLYGDLDGNFDELTWQEAIVNANDELATKTGLKKKPTKIALKDDKGKIWPLNGKIRDFLNTQEVGDYYEINLIEKPEPKPQSRKRMSKLMKETQSTQQTSYGNGTGNVFVPPPASSLHTHIGAPTTESVFRQQFNTQLENWNDRQLKPCKDELQALYDNNRPLFNQIMGHLPRTAHLLIQCFQVDTTVTSNGVRAQQQ